LKVQTIGVSFQTNTITVKAGDKVELDFTNCATFAHNFTAPGLNTPVVDIPGAAPNVPVTFTAPTTPGRYMFWCSIAPAGSPSHAERGMTGEIIVQ